MCAGKSKLSNCQLQMSLRSLYRNLHKKSQTYLVHDGRHVFMHSRHADQVYALAQEYLRAKMPGFGSSHVRATHVCQDYMELKLLRCLENNEPKRWVSRDISLRSICRTTLNGLFSYRPRFASEIFTIEDSWFISTSLKGHCVGAKDCA